ncbi:MAG: hypothetical protein MJ156_00715 [Alphaproteobacteria bacterium]|nr:hypothetical protein [Alphaproteobacteria bacterium]
MKKIIVCLSIMLLAVIPAYSASVIATVNGNAITDDEVTARVKLMTKQGNNSLDNMQKAFQNIVDDYIKIEYVSNFGVKPTDEDADKEIEKMKLGELTPTMRSMARLGVKSDICWNVMLGQTIIPTIKLTKKEKQQAKIDLARERGLPVELTLVRVVDIPKDVYKQLKDPKDCDDAITMVQTLGGEPQKFKILQYELSQDMRERVAELDVMKWAPLKDKSTVLICEANKTDEYQNLDEMIEQNAIYMRASAIGDQQLKQLRRKAMIIINDDRYKL